MSHAVLYTDGSCSPNPGNGGFGIYGYIYDLTEKNKNFKHPIYPKYYFTKEGILEKRDNDNLEVKFIIEYIKALKGSSSTNNEAELLAVITALEKGKSIENLESLTIITDSNYIVTSYNENIEKWINNNWKRQDGKTIVHKEDWLLINELSNWYKVNNIELKLSWVKGHSTRYGNKIADLFANIGSNTSKQLIDKELVIYDSISSFTEYKKSFSTKDFIFNFRDLYFSSDDIDDNDYCFISSTEDPEVSGKRNTFSIFITNVGYRPPVIDKFKKFFRSIDRNYRTTCCIKLSKFTNKEILRLTNIIEPIFLLTKLDSTTYSIIGEHTPFLFENIIKFPFVKHIYEIFDRMCFLHENKDTDSRYIKKDITDLIIKDNKLIISNQDKFLDYSEILNDIAFTKQKVILRLGYDIPSYLSLKNIEKDIQKIFVILETNDSSNFYTLYTYIRTFNREVYSINVESKYLKRIK